MGWAHCGTDTQDREIGYAIEATCDHPGCSEEIHRGLAYACGDMHGADGFSCEGYFCEDHRFSAYDPDDARWKSYCKSCAADLEAQKAEDFEHVLVGLVRRVKPLRYLITDTNEVSYNDEIVGRIVEDKGRYTYHNNAGTVAVSLGKTPPEAVERFNILMNPESGPVSLEEHIQQVYDVLLRWDETTELQPDTAYMSEEAADRLRKEHEIRDNLLKARLAPKTSA